MAHVITDKCLGEQRAKCVEVCPVECIYLGKFNGQKFAVIDPDTCIDCGVCLPECPVNAIVGFVDENPEWARINRELAPKFQRGEDADGDSGAGVRVDPPKDPPPLDGHNLQE